MAHQSYHHSGYVYINDDQPLDANGQPLYGTQGINGDEYYEEEPVYDDTGYPADDYHEEPLYVQEGYEGQPMESVDDTNLIHPHATHGTVDANAAAPGLDPLQSWEQQAFWQEPWTSAAALDPPAGQASGSKKPSKAKKDGRAEGKHKSKDRKDGGSSSKRHDRSDKDGGRDGQTVR